MYGIGRQAALTMASTAHLCRGFSLVLMYWRGAGARGGGGGGGGLVVGNKTVYTDTCTNLNLQHIDRSYILVSPTCAALSNALCILIRGPLKMRLM